MVVSNRKGPATIKVLFLMYLMVTKLVTVFRCYIINYLGWALEAWHGALKLGICLWKLGVGFRSLAMGLGMLVCVYGN